MSESDSLAAHQRTALKVGGAALVALAYQSLGIIYSDVGTSPLYVLNGIWPASGPAPSKEDVIGGISAIIWSLTLLPLVKYVIICLQFGTGEGEGGSFALFQGLYPRRHSDPGMERSLTVDSMSGPKHGTGISPRLRWPLLFWCLLGTSLTLADGVFTPAVSVTSAVGGIAVAKASISADITPIAIAFLVLLFLVQPLGTHRLARLYSPITAIWFFLIGGSGIANIVSYPGIFRAFDPSRAVMLFVRTGNYDYLAGILLCVTGTEAIFANLGQFNATSIRLSFITTVYPALILAYLGQGARLIVDGDTVITNVFYTSIPGKANGPLFWIIYVWAILATLVASQAMITATFSLAQQLINMKSLPPLRMVYTSETAQGQVYIPALNWTLMIACLVIVGVFQNLAAMTNAYGFAVSTVFFTTTLVITLQIRYVKQRPIFLAILFFVAFGFLDGIFWGASLRKVPHGAWVPLIIGIVILSVMTFWTWAKGLEDAFDGANRQNLRRFIIPRDQDGDSSKFDDFSAAHGDIDEAHDPTSSFSTEKTQLGYDYVAPKIQDSNSTDEQRNELVRINSCAVFYRLSAGTGVPHSFVGFIRRWPALPRVVIFLSVRVLPIARVAEEERYMINKVSAVEGFYTTTYYIGFRDDFDVQVPQIVEKICALEQRSGGDPIKVAERVQTVRRCASEAMTHVVPHYHVLSKPVNAGFMSGPVNFVRRYLIESVYQHMAAMFPETENWLSSADDIIHVGVNASI